MARFKRLTVEEARQMTRGELVDRLDVESGYWERKFRRGQARVSDEAYQVFTECLHMIDVGTALSDALSYFEGRGGGGYFDTRPCDDPRTDG